LWCSMSMPWFMSPWSNGKFSNKNAALFDGGRLLKTDAASRVSTMLLVIGYISIISIGYG
jgi:hypothetical protein